MSKLSQTRIKVRLRRKTNPEMLELLRLARKNKSWSEVVKILSGSTRLYSSINLGEIDKEAKLGETMVVLGKVLSSGNVSKKIKICALGISDEAKEKLKDTKSEYSSVLQEIKSNPKAVGIKLIR